MEHTVKGLQYKNMEILRNIYFYLSRFTRRKRSRQSSIEDKQEILSLTSSRSTTGGRSDLGQGEERRFGNIHMKRMLKINIT